jgi:hypothetical protein
VPIKLLHARNPLGANGEGSPDAKPRKLKPAKGAHAVPLFIGAPPPLELPPLENPQPGASTGELAQLRFAIVCSIWAHFL